MLRHRGFAFEQLESRDLLAATVPLTDSIWQNRFDPIDANRDGVRAPNDLLIIVNELNRGNSRQLTQPRDAGDSRSLLDVNGDGWLTPFDAKAVAEVLNADSISIEGEEGCPSVSVTLSDLLPGGATADIYENTLFVISGSAPNATSVSLTGTGDFALIDPPPEPYPHFEFDPTTGFFQATVIYFDDGHSSDPNAGATEEDLQTITASATNGCSSASDSMDVLVKNIAPTIDVAEFAAPEIDEGDTAILQLTVTEMSPYDSIRVNIDWGDGTQDIRFLGSGPPVVIPGVSSLIGMLGLPQPSTYQLGVDHIYRDDNPTNTPTDTYQVNISITDDDLGTNDTTTSIVVDNVAPQIVIDEIIPIDNLLAEIDPETGWPMLLNPGQIDESEGFRVLGHVTDVGILDTHTVTVKADLNWDSDFEDSGEEITISGGGGYWTFVATFSAVPDDGPSNLPWQSNDTLVDDVHIRVDVEDDDLGSATLSSAATVYNTAPQVFVDDVILTPDPEDEGAIASIILEGHVTDLGALDLHEVTITWADGLIDTQLTPSDEFTFTRTLTAPYADETELLFPISVIAKDDDRSQGETSVPKVNLQIGYGMSHETVADKYEFKDGAITVANLNDTDGDGKIDVSDDDGVIDVIHNGQFNEVDLMPVRINKPQPYDPSKRLTLTTKGAVRFWADQNKQNPESLIAVDTLINDWPEGVGFKLIWAEITAASSALRDVEIELKYDQVTDVVRATGIWTTFTVEHNRKTPAELFAQFPDLDNDNRANHINVKAAITLASGTGLNPPAEFIHNGILIEFQVSPKEVRTYQGGVIWFDVSRRMEWTNRELDSSDNQSYFCHLPFPTLHPDATNDDNNDTDESSLVDRNGHFYSYDAPAARRDTGQEWTLRDHETINGDFEEFLRVDIKSGAMRPHGGTNVDYPGCEDSPEVSGSRASSRISWEVNHTLQNEGGTMKRTTGDQTEVPPENNIG